KLQQILMGTTTLSRANNGDTVKSIQQALSDLGYTAPLYGSDGSLGRETARLVKSFQRAQGLPVTGIVNRATLSELDRVATQPGQKLEKYPEYDRMFADGYLTTTFAVGYDEDNSHPAEISKIQSGLETDGYTEMDASDSTDANLLRGAGYDPTNMPAGVTYYHKTFAYQGKPVDSIVQLITPDTPDAVNQFTQGMIQSDMVVYMGHARYGTGPDFDPKESTAGNYVIGVNSTAHK